MCTNACYSIAYKRLSPYIHLGSLFLRLKYPHEVSHLILEYISRAVEEESEGGNQVCRKDG